MVNRAVPRLIYRVEHCDTRVGPYRTSGDHELERLICKIPGGRDGDAAHPPPYDELGEDWIEVGERSYHNRFGFGSVRAAKAWFGEQLAPLILDFGFVLGIYYARPGCYLIGKYQAVFCAMNALRAGEYTLNLLERN